MGLDFWENMKFLLKEAIDLDIYEEQNFSSDPVEYCGTTINASPLKILSMYKLIIWN